MTRKPRRRNDADVEAQPEEEIRQDVAHEMSILKSGLKGEPSGGTESNVLVEKVDGETQAGSSTRSQAHFSKDGPSYSGENNSENVQSCDDRTSGDVAQPTPSEMPRMIGDFDANANAMWSLHLGEAKSHDEARIHSLKDDMDSVLIFAGLFSAALTSFLIDSVNNLQVDPAQQMVYYQQQNVALFAQISEQISSIVPQVTIQSTLPPPYPTFSPNRSDVRVNVYWFMSLVFSLSAALLATLVQQWVRDYMHVFQRYGNPLKSARLRQYLYEGVEGWYMPRVARSVPGLVHVSLFLFFLGLGGSLLSVHVTVGITTITPIAICGFLYVLSTFAPVLNPQSPFQNPFTGLIWYLKQKVHPRRYLDRASGASLKAVSASISEGQMQLAMEECGGRKDRDVRAIRWLIHNRTEDDEMESFVMAIPGAFTSKWGIDVWRTVSEVPQYEDTNLRPNDPTDGLQSDTDLPISVRQHRRSPLFQYPCHLGSLLQPLGRLIGISNGTSRHVPLTQSIPRLLRDDQAPTDLYSCGDLAIFDLCKRVRHLLSTCDNHCVFTNQGLWLQRTRGCIETVASLVVCADMNPELFGDLGPLLFRMSDFVPTEVSQVLAPGSDGLFLARWTYLSFVIVYRGTANHDGIQLDAHVAINRLSRFRIASGDEQSISGDDGDGDDENALRNAQRIDDYFESATQFCMYDLREVFETSEAEMTEEQVREVLARDHEVNICMLERFALVVDHVANIDRAILRVTEPICDFSRGLIQSVRGAHFYQLQQEDPIHPIQFFVTTDQSSVYSPQFIVLHQRLRFLCSYSSKLRDIIDGRGNGAYQEILESLGTLWSKSDKLEVTEWSGIHGRHLMERQLWRLQDLRDGGGFGFWVEMFFLVAQQLLTLSLPPDAHSFLIIGMFGTITSNWRQHKHSIGTQRVILNLICDMAILRRGLSSDYNYPRYITDELLILMEKMVEGGLVRILMMQ